jgi:hypothetical protein
VFEKTLTAKLKNIFNVKKVTFDHPGESREQECIFINVENARVTIKDGREICRVNGTLVFYANNEKLPYAFFFKKIRDAALSDVKDLHFSPEQNTGLYENIVERSMDFVYFYDSQYDPDLGILNEVNFQQQVSE